MNNNTINFTKDRLDNLPIPQSKREFYYDSKENKLYIQITPTGVKTFYLLKKINKRSEKISIGRYPDMTIDNARNKAKQLKSEISIGKNPAEEKRGIRQEITFQEMFNKFGKDYKSKMSSWKNDVSNYNNCCKHLADRTISSITKEQLQRLINKITSERSIYTANRTLELIRAMYNKMIEWGWNGNNPTKGIKKHPEVKRTRFILPEELFAFRSTLAKQEQYFQDIVIIALFTGVRKSNIFAMKWNDISLELETWTIKADESKNGEEMVITLPQDIIDIIKRRKKETDSPWVFPSPFESKSGHITDIKKKWATFLDEVQKKLEAIGKHFNIKNLRIHDLRRTYGSYLAINGSSLLIIGKALGHKSSKSTEIYARLSLSPVAISQIAAIEYMKKHTQKDEEDAK